MNSSKWFQSFCFTLKSSNLRPHKSFFDKERDKKICNQLSSNVTNLTGILALAGYATVACEKKKVHFAFSKVSEVALSKWSVVSLACKKSRY